VCVFPSIYEFLFYFMECEKCIAHFPMMMLHKLFIKSNLLAEIICCLHDILWFCRFYYTYYRYLHIKNGIWCLMAFITFSPITSPSPIYVSRRAILSPKPHQLYSINAVNAKSGMCVRIRSPHYTSFPIQKFHV
jgi:hypothetical protein